MHFLFTPLATQLKRKQYHHLHDYSDPLEVIVVQSIFLIQSVALLSIKKILKNSVTTTGKAPFA